MIINSSSGDIKIADVQRQPPWSEPLIHLQMVTTTSGGRLPIRVPQTVVLNKYSSGTYHVLSTGKLFPDINIFKPHTTPWIRDYYPLVEMVNLGTKKFNSFPRLPGEYEQCCNSSPGSQTPR